MKKYQSYKPSGLEWVDNLPEHWTIGKLKNVSNLIISSVDKHILENEKSVFVCNYTDVYYNEFISSDLDFKLGSCSDDEYKKFLLKKGDVIITKDSESPSDIGVPSLVIDDLGNVVCGYHLSILKPNSEKIIGGFLFRQLQTKRIRCYYEVCSNGITRFGLGKSSVLDTPLVLPPISEQIQIVKFLDEKTELIDKLISTKEQKIILLKEQRTSLINQVITKGLNPNVIMKDSNVEWIGEIPEHWVVKKMKHFVRICNGSDYKDFVLEDGGFPVYGTGGVFSRCSRFLYDKPSVLLGRKGSVDKPQFVNEPFWTSDTTYYTEIKENVSPMYFFHLVKQIQFEQFIYGSAIPSMTKSVYDDMLFPYPPLYEQEKIVEYLDDKIKEIDDLVSIEQKKIDLLKEYRQSLISEVITGKIDVRTHLN